LSVRRHVEGTRKAYQKLLKKYDATVSVENTPADKLIGQLFASAELLRDDEDTVRRAYFRYLRGHPPRKNDGSFGDAIAWELLLSSASDDLVLITRDGDFSERRRGIVSVNGFLEREWHAKHQGKKVEIYESLGEFINSFEKRRAVKNEVVEKEKSSLLNAILAYPSGPGGSFLSGNVLGTPNTVSYVMGGGTPVFTKAGTLTNLNSIFQAPNTVSYLIGGGTPFLATPETVSFVGQNANPFLTGPISQSSQERNTAAKLCPNCKGDLEIALKEALKSSSTADRPSKFACPHCNCEIDPAKLD